MSSQNIAVEVNGASKVYKLFDKPSHSMWHYLFKVDNAKDFAALESVSFTIQRGETFGIIGQNGSGKSTLLQILAKIILPTEGSVGVYGRVSALLELGSGFNPEATGLENIYMGATVLGLAKKELESKLDEIIKFADIGEFLDQPVKTYSSGMYVRLAFSLVINVDADIILIDEALAVGDIFFRQKCYAKLNELREQGKTIVLVTHALNEVEQFCSRALLLDKGKQLFLGSGVEAVKRYYFTTQRKTSKESLDKIFEASTDVSHNMEELGDEHLKQKVLEGEGLDLSMASVISSGGAKITKVCVFDECWHNSLSFKMGDVANFAYEVEVYENTAVPMAGILFTDEKLIIVHGKSSLQTNTKVPAKVTAGSKVYVAIKVKLDIKPGEYLFEISFADMPLEHLNNFYNLTQEELNEEVSIKTIVSKLGPFCVHRHDRLPFYGMCDLDVGLDVYIDDKQL